jgi:hypothetical protein
MLSPWNSSFVELETVAVLRMSVSTGVPEFTLYTNVKVAISLRARPAIMHVDVPV